jgi:tRNA-dihydrouridine synthase B
LRIGNIEIKNNTVLAPMAGVTDLPFRNICKELGVGLVCAEMVSAKGLFHENEKTEKMLQISELEHPISLQLFGSDPKILHEMVKKLDEYPIDIIDINMGCPAKKIIKNLEGSALLKDPKLVGNIVKAMSSATKKPVTVKIRKGYNDSNINAVEVAKIIEHNGAAAIAIHGRTREEFFTGKVDLDIIKQVKQSVSIPVIGNGDILTPQDAKNMMEQTNCDGVMIARGAQGNPWIFKRIAWYLETGELLEAPTLDERIEVALRHGRMLIEYKGELKGMREMRKHVAWYTKGLHDSAKVRLDINKATTYNELEYILNELRN